MHATMTKRQQMRRALHAEAAAAAQSAYSAAFQRLARAAGGFTSINAADIRAEATAAAAAAREQVFLARGYGRCGGGCGRLTSPGFDACPNCTPAPQP